MGSVGVVELVVAVKFDTELDDTTADDGLGLTFRLTVEEVWPRAV